MILTMRVGDRLDDDARPVDVVPLHGDAQRGVARAPAARAQHQVRAALLAQARVELADLLGDVSTYARRFGASKGEGREAMVRATVIGGTYQPCSGTRP